MFADLASKGANNVHLQQYAQNVLRIFICLMEIVWPAKVHVEPVIEQI